MEHRSSFEPGDDKQAGCGGHMQMSWPDGIYRPYFTAAILMTLTAGATWGAWLLWRIASAGSFTALGIAEINAHGHAQITGWVVLFIMGFAYQALPRLWGGRLPAPGLAKANLFLMLTGIVIRTAGMAFMGKWDFAVQAAMIGGSMEILGILLFCGQIGAIWACGRVSWQPHTGFVFAAMLFLCVQAVFGLVHTFNTMTAASWDELLWYVATYQTVLRDLQIHGLALIMILGMSLRLLPAYLGVPETPCRQAWLSLVLLTSAVSMEVAFFIIYRHTGNHAIAGLLLIPWLMLPVGAGLTSWSWWLWRPSPACVPGAKFIRIAFGWLYLSFIMLACLPVYQRVSGVPFSHAYYGAIRHAITVGFVSMMIVGVSWTVIPKWRGLADRRLSRLWGPFLLLNAGCALRVGFQTLTDWHHIGFQLIGISGLVEVTALAWWSLHLLNVMRRSPEASTAAGATHSAPIIHTPSASS